ncbi:hypothetical protein [Agathobacter sp.]
MLRIIYNQWLLNTKNVVILIEFALINSNIINKMNEVYNQSGQPFGILESGIMLSNSGLVVVMLSVIFIMTMSDYPNASEDFYYHEIRTGRKQWYRSQVLFAILGTITYMIAIFGFAIIMVEKISFVANGWSTNITSYGQKYGLLSYIPLQLFNQMRPVKAYVLSSILIFTYLMFIMAIQMLGFVFGKKKQALISNILILIVGVCMSFFKNNIMWLFPFANSILWLHYDKYFKTTDLKVYGSIILYIFAIVVIYIFSYRHFMKEDIDRMKEEIV